MKQLLVLATAAQGRKLVRALRSFRALHWDLWFIPLRNAEPPQRERAAGLAVVYAIGLPDGLLPGLQHLLETRIRDTYLLCLCVRRVCLGCHPQDHAFLDTDWAVWSQGA